MVSKCLASKIFFLDSAFNFASQSFTAFIQFKTLKFMRAQREFYFPFYVVSKPLPIHTLAFTKFGGFGPVRYVINFSGYNWMNPFAFICKYTVSLFLTAKKYRLWTKVFARWRRPFFSKTIAGNKTYFLYYLDCTNKLKCA